MKKTKASGSSLLRRLQSRLFLGRNTKGAQHSRSSHAHDLQMRILSGKTPQLEGLQIACAWQPSPNASGDYFDVLPFSENKLGLCIADVSGKGRPAVLLKSNLQTSVKTFARDDLAPSALCSQLNAMLSDTIESGRYVSLFYGLLDRRTRTLRYESAGHCRPLLVHANGTIEIPEASSGVLGMFSHWTYSDHDLQLVSGDVLVMMTDGVLEASNAKEEEFGYQRLIATVLASRNGGADLIRHRVFEDITTFCAGNFVDDASLIVLTVD